MVYRYLLRHTEAEEVTWYFDVILVPRPWHKRLLQNGRVRLHVEKMKVLLTLSLALQASRRCSRADGQQIFRVFGTLVC